MKLGSDKHKAEFLQQILKESYENVWKNEMHLLRLSDELEPVQEELDALNKIFEAKNGPPANEQKKRQFVLESTIRMKQKEIANVEAAKALNTHVIENLIPRYINS